jgi:hypothetical protein
MRSVLRAALAAATAGALAVTLAPATAAATAEIPSSKEIKAALDRMLTYADAPRILDVAPGWEFTVKADTSLKQELCTRFGQEISGPKTSLLFQVELGESDDVGEDPVSTEQKVWQYRSTAAALRDWQIMERRVKQCSGRTREPDGEGRYVVQYLSNGRTDVTVEGRSGIWIHSDYKASRVLSADAGEGGYYVLFLVGDTIQSVEYDYPDNGKLSMAKRRAVDRMTKTLADRWLAGS